MVYQAEDEIDRIKNREQWLLRAAVQSIGKMNV
jgi:hypothetical protein